MATPTDPIAALFYSQFMKRGGLFNPTVTGAEPAAQKLAENLATALEATIAMYQVAPGIPIEDGETAEPGSIVKI